MKIGGVDPTTLPCEEILVLPRGNKQIVFRASGLKDAKDFDRLCPELVPPQKLIKGGQVADTGDQGYKDALASYEKRRSAYVVVHTLAPSQIEWDTVQLDNPATWDNWEADLKNAGLTTIECGRVMALVMEANSLDEKKLQEARELFLQGMPGQ